MGRAKAPKVIQVETCITREKIFRHRGILKLHARDKKLQLSKATKLKSAAAKKLVSLDVNVKRLRETVKNVSKSNILKLLSDYNEFYLAFSQLQPFEIYEAAYEESDVKRRFLDKLYYKKKKKLRYAILLQLERNDLSSKCKDVDELHYEQQQLVIRLQQSISKYNAAKTIHSSYLSILCILKKDTMFFDTLLNILKEDQFSQCKAMLRVTVMGQLAAENLDDIKQKYKRMTRVILRNMKYREESWNNLHCQVQDLWDYALSLMRTESEAVLVNKDADKSSDDKILENELIHLEDICDQLKEALLVRSYHHLLPRFQDQAEQRTNLLTKLNGNIKNRDSLLNKTNHAVQVLEGFKHSKTAAEQYKLQGCEILEQIKIEKKREKDIKELKKNCGELITIIKVALQNMNTMLFCIKHPDKFTEKKKTGKDISKDIFKKADKEDTNKLESLAEFPEINNDG